MKDKYDIGEFVSYKLEENNEGFRIIIEGSKKYKVLIANKIQEITIDDDDLKEYT